MAIESGSSSAGQPATLVDGVRAALVERPGGDALADPLAALFVRLWTRLDEVSWRAQMLAGSPALPEAQRTTAANIARIANVGDVYAEMQQMLKAVNQGR